MSFTLPSLLDDKYGLEEMGEMKENIFFCGFKKNNLLIQHKIAENVNIYLYIEFTCSCILYIVLQVKRIRIGREQLQDYPFRLKYFYLFTCLLVHA